MKKKNREKLRLITLRVCIGILCAFVIAVFIRSYYYRSKESNLDIKSWFKNHKAEKNGQYVV